MVDMPGMQEGTIKIRRGKRTDFPALIALVHSQSPCEANKGQVRHWRRLAGDPSLDFYIAEQEGTIRGMVLVCYIRELSRPGWQAILDVVAPVSEECGIGRALLDFVKGRARKRGCQRLLVYKIAHEGDEWCASLTQAGFHRVGDVLCCGLS